VIDMMSVSALIKFLMDLMRDDAARAEFDQDPQGTLSRHGLDDVRGQDVRDARLIMADGGGVRARSGHGSESGSRGDDPVREIHHTTTHYVINEGPTVGEIDQRLNVINIDDRDTTVIDSFNSADSTDVDVVAVQDNSTDIDVTDIDINDTDINDTDTEDSLNGEPAEDDPAEDEPGDSDPAGDDPADGDSAGGDSAGGDSAGGDPTGSTPGDEPASDGPADGDPIGGAPAAGTPDDQPIDLIDGEPVDSDPAGFDPAGSPVDVEPVDGTAAIDSEPVMDEPDLDAVVI
jgi:hypothetical protein